MTDHDVTLGASSWSDLPTALLQAELQRRQDDGTERPVCGSGIKGQYNTPAHVFALALILFLSTLACGFPLFSQRISKHAGVNKYVFLSQHFGTGVLIATAFVHLLPTAFVSLTDPCLGYIWRRYRPMAGLIAMVSALIVVGIEQLLRTRGIGHSHSHGEDWDAVSTEDHEEHHRNGTTRHAPRKSYGLGKHRPKDIALGDMESTLGLVDNVSPYPEPSPAQDDNGDYSNEEHQKSDDDNDSDLDLNELDPSTQTGAGQERQRSTSPPAATPEEEQKKRYLQCMLLEAGILFHSVFIGMAVSVATGTPFVIFLIAIAFHQSFEGLALGSRIAQVGFPRSSWKPWAMVLAYGLTTPAGQLVGLLVHSSYDPRSAEGLIMVGIMNSISSGLLLFAGLVQLLAEDFLADKSYTILQGKKRVHAYMAVLGGALLMALVGAWA